MANGIQFFGPVDQVRDKESGETKISSSYPAWYFESHIGMLSEERDRHVRALQRGDILSPDYVEHARLQIRKIDERIEAIQASKPELRPKDKDRIAKAHKAIGEEIRSEMPSRSEMAKGLPNVKRLVTSNKEAVHSIGEFGDLYEAANIKSIDGRVSGDQKAKLWKILGKLLDENTNTEGLRREYKHGTFRSDVPLEELLKERL